MRQTCEPDTLGRDAALDKNIVDLENVDLTLTSRAGAVHILRGLSLTVPAGQSLAIVGPSGSGKTSLLMLIAGLERATGGQVTVAPGGFH